MKGNEQDLLKTIFGRMPEDTLPVGFQTIMMQRINKEAMRIARRNQRLQVLSLIAASIFMVGLSIAAIVYLWAPQIDAKSLQTGLQSITTGFPRISIPPYYIYFGLLVLVLLLADHLFRNLYYKKHTASRFT